MMTTYKKRDYTFGQAMFTLRTAIGLTQEEPGNRLCISRRAVGKWEAGSSYPKPEHLKEVITLGVKSQAFSAGREAEEIRAFWSAAHQKMLLDENWLCALLQRQAQVLHAALPHGTTLVEPVAVDLTSGPEEHGGEEDLTVPPASSDLDNASITLPNLLRDAPLVSLGKTKGQRKWLLALVLTLVILAITGAGGMLLLQARNHRGEQAQKITPTQTHSYPAYLPGSGRLSFFDPLSRQGGSQWKSFGPTYYGGSCQFTKGAYHASQQPNDYYASCLTLGTFSNFAFEVQLTIMQGDCGGMLFRYNGNGHFYYFHICEDGTYWVGTFVDDISSHAKDPHSGSTSAIHTGLDQQNKIAVVASGSTLTFYANEQQIVQMQDSSSTSGSIALIANPGYGNVTDVAYSNARLWTL